MITFETKGDFKRATNFLSKSPYVLSKVDLHKYGRQGVEALQNATPKDTGLTANSWTYEIKRGNGTVSISFNNTNIQNGIPVVILLRYGHATRSGTFVTGLDFVTPAVAPIFESIAENVWKEVTTS